MGKIKKTLNAQTAGNLILSGESIKICYYDQDENEFKEISGRLTGYSPNNIGVESLSGKNLSLDLDRIKSITNIKTQITLHIGDKETIYKQSTGGGRED